MRLFTAVDPSTEVLDKLAQLLDRLRPTARLRWNHAEKLHLTLKFIGEWPAGRLEELRQALAAVQPPPAFQVRITGVGYFPHARAPRIFWAGVAPSPELKELAGRVDWALEPLGIPQEQRLYSPHLTLARIADRQPIGALNRVIDELPTLDFGAFTADCFYLYESRPGAGGSVYTRIGEFGLAATPAGGHTAGPSDPPATPTSGHTAGPSDAAATPASGHTAAPSDPPATPTGSHTAGPSDPAATPTGGHTAGPSDPAATPTSGHTAGPSDPAATRPGGRTAASSDPAATPTSSHTAGPSDPAATPASGRAAGPSDAAATPAGRNFQ